MNILLTFIHYYNPPNIALTQKRVLINVIVKIKGMSSVFTALNPFIFILIEEENKKQLTK